MRELERENPKESLFSLNSTHSKTEEEEMFFLFFRFDLEILT